jgi:hypothetical protein
MPCALFPKGVKALANVSKMEYFGMTLKISTGYTHKLRTN